MFCIIVEYNKILGVMMERNLEKESRWDLKDFNKLPGSSGWALYTSEELKGFEEFTKLYGYQLIYNREGIAYKVLDREEREIEFSDLQILDVSCYPEVKTFLHK